MIPSTSGHSRDAGLDWIGISDIEMKAEKKIV